MTRIVIILLFIMASSFIEEDVREIGIIDIQEDLVGYWTLKGDCLDHSGSGNNGINHGVDLRNGTFNGSSSYIEIPDHASLNQGTGDFTINAWVYTEKVVNDVIGDVVSKYDPSLRRGITLSVNSGAGGYQSIGTDRHVYFGIDNARGGVWQDCGKPGAGSNFMCISMTVYKGKLYAAGGNSNQEEGRCHVYRYEGGTKWTDCGRIGTGKNTSVGPMIVHDGGLYVVTTASDIGGVNTEGSDPGKVYRFEGINEWIDCGQPGDNPTIYCIASYNGKLFTGGGPLTWAVYTQHESDIPYVGNRWIISKIFPEEGSQRCFPHSMMVHNNKLYAGSPYVFSFNGKRWAYEGAPAMTEKMPQIHSMTVFRGRLCAGTGPGAQVSMYSGNEEWKLLGRAGDDGTEVNSLVVYNGKLYGGSMPRSEVCRYDDDEQWTSLKRLNEGSRLTSLTIYDGRLYASTGSDPGSLSATTDAGGNVFCMEAGKVATFDLDLGQGWKQITAVRKNGILKLFINGIIVKTTSSFSQKDYNVSNNKPLLIGFGETDYFNGKIAEVRMYNRALDPDEVLKLFTGTKLHINVY